MEVSKTVSSNDGHITITAFDLDLDGSLNTGTAAASAGGLYLHGSSAGQSMTSVE